MIDERTRRTERFRGEAPVVLADGQTWHLPKPRARFAPDAGPSGLRIVLTLKGSDEYQGLTEAVKKAEERARGDAADGDEGDGRSLTACTLDVAAHLIRFNYDLSDDELTGLVQFSYDEDDDPDGFRIRQEILDVAFGRGPKARGGSSE